MYDIKDKILLITGGAAGIGASVVRIFLEENIKHVTILDIHEKNGLDIERELNSKYGSNRVKFIKCDITHEQDLLNAFSLVKSEHGYIDIVINNAGIVNDKIFAKAIETNVTATVRGTLQAWDVMNKDKGGRGGTIINISSVAGITHHPLLPIYSAAKAAVLKFSTTIGDDFHYSTTGVRVLSVCFGVTDTPMINGVMPSFDSNLEEEIIELLKCFKWQSSAEAAKGVRDLYKQGKSGSVWIVSSGKPAVDVTDRYIQTTKVFDDIVMN